MLCDNVNNVAVKFELSSLRKNFTQFQMCTICSFYQVNCLQTFMAHLKRSLSLMHINFAEDLMVLRVLKFFCFNLGILAAFISLF